MDTQPAFGFKEFLHYLIGDMAKAISERNGESKQEQFLRCQAAVQMMMGFLPRDVIEAVLAGRCMMFHEMMVDTVRLTLRGEVDSARVATRGSIVAMDKAFGNNLRLLERYQLRPSVGRRDAPEAQVAEFQPAQVPAGMDNVGEMAPLATNVAGPEAANPAIPVEAPQTRVHAACDPIAPMEPRLDDTAVDFHPSPETIAACRANPEAMEALEAGDVERFARAMGVDMPTEAYLAAAASQGIVVGQEAAGESKG
jgi:hypothetical protein